MSLLGLGLALFGPFALAALSERRTGPARLGESLAAQGVLLGIVGGVLWIAFGVEG